MPRTAAVKAPKPGAAKAASKPVVKTRRLDNVALPATGKTVDPLAAEFLNIGKRLIDTGRGIRVHRTVREQEHVVHEPLNQDELHVERGAINRFVDASETPSIRQEEEVTVVAIFEEVLLTEKRLLLKEEVRITRMRR